MSNIIDDSDYKNKYLKYKHKYLNLKKKTINDNNNNNIVILPEQYNNLKHKKLYKIYETNETGNPISYIKKDYYDKYVNNDESEFNTEQEIMKKNIISLDEYFMLSDKNKLKYDINEFDTTKYSNRIVPKNYIKI
jgi:hypothetical protein